MSSSARTVFSNVTFAGLEGADAVQRGVADGDGLAHGREDFVGGHFKLRQADDGIKWAARCSKASRP